MQRATVISVSSQSAPGNSEIMFLYSKKLKMNLYFHTQCSFVPVADELSSSRGLQRQRNLLTELIDKDFVSIMDEFSPNHISSFVSY